MIKKIILALAFSCISIIAGNNAFADDARTMPSLAPILKNAMPAIVNIAVQGVIFAPDSPGDEDGSKSPELSPSVPLKPKKFQSIGSGVIYDPKEGLIITNDHVIRNAKLITVTLNDGRRLKAKLIGSDSETDIALLHVDADHLKSLPLGDSDIAEVGDFVVAIGNPFGLNSFGNSQSATFGIISALKRSDLNIEGIENFIQTDAAINPGNSGGALVNTKGELIGINTAILSPFSVGGNIGIGFAIPINMVKDILPQLIKYGSVHRGLMGIFVQHLNPELAQALGYSEDFQGALITQVNPQSPAEKSGLKAGDIIVQINSTPITESAQVRTTISLLRVGSTAKITVMRDNHKLSVNAIVTDVKKHEQKLQASNPFLYGLAFRNFEQDSPLHGHVIGVQIVGASENSAGWRAGLRPGDVIVSANKQPVRNIEAFQSIAAQNKKQLLLQILRETGALFILVV